MTLVGQTLLLMISSSLAFKVMNIYVVQTFIKKKILPAPQPPSKKPKMHIWTYVFSQDNIHLEGSINVLVLC